MHPFFLYLRNAMLGAAAGYIVILIANYCLAEYITPVTPLPPPASGNYYFAGRTTFHAPGLVLIGVLSGLIWTRHIQTSAQK